jgi:hypothetical protein
MLGSRKTQHCTAQPGLYLHTVITPHYASLGICRLSLRARSACGTASLLLLLKRLLHIA